MEKTKSVIRWGNGGGILLPRGWIGKEVRIILIDRTPQIKKEVFDMLDSYLEDIIGIYLVGSYARNEQDKSSDIDIIAVSNSTNKEISSGRYHISIYSLESIKKTLQDNPIMIYPRLKEAKILLNKEVLKQLNSIQISRDKFGEFIKDIKRIIKINEEIINLDKIEGENLQSTSIIYSLLLRLRAVFLIKIILKRKKYSNESFIRWMKENIGDDFNKAYLIYKSIKDNQKLKIKIDIRINTAEKLLHLLKKEVAEFDR